MPTLEERITALEAAVSRLTEALTDTVSTLKDLAGTLKPTAGVLQELAGLVKNLVEAQVRLEKRLEALEGGLDRLEATLTRLAEAQAGTEKRLEELARAQAETEKRLAGFIRVTERQERELGRFSQRIGPVVESRLAAALLEKVLPARSLTPLETRARPIEVNGLEVDLVIRVRDPAGRTFRVLAECRGRVRIRDVREVAAKLKNPKNLARLKGAGLDGPFIVYLGGLQVYHGVEEAAGRAGIGLFDPAGELVPAGPALSA